MVLTDSAIDQGKNLRYQGQRKRSDTEGELKLSGERNPARFSLYLPGLL